MLGIKTHVDGDGLKVFGSGTHDLDFNKSKHFPGKISISFFSDDIPQCIAKLEAAGVAILERFGDPVCAIVLQDPDGCRVEIKNQHG